MRNLRNKQIIPIGDPPSTFRRALWGLMRRCKKCGSICEDIQVCDRHRELYIVRKCTHCGCINLRRLKYPGPGPGPSFR